MKQVLKIFGILFAICLMNACDKDKKSVIDSPDGKTSVSFILVDGSIYYSVGKEGKSIVNLSALGFELNGQPSFKCPFRVKNIGVSSFDETWEQPWGEEITVRNHYNEMKIELQEKSDEKRLLNLTFRAFNDGIGFRYEIPGQANIHNFEISSEITEFALATNDSAWSIPAYKGEYYEMLWAKSPVNKLDTVTTPITIETADGKYIAIHEANLTDYPKMNLYPEGTTLKTDLTPWANGIKTYSTTPFVSPWRIIILADDLNQLVNSRMMLNLNEPCKIEDTSWIKPAKYVGIWWGMHMEKYSWSQGPKHGATTKNTKAYIDFAAAHHIQGVLVEGWNYGWDGNWVANGNRFSFTRPYPDYALEELVRYAAGKNIELIGHNETGGATVNYENQLDSAFRFYNKLGIHAVKTGYVNKLLDKKERHSSQYGVRHFRKVIETAAQYRIMIDNHEPVMPTGLQRTYPNLMTQEGVRGQEYDAWSQDGGNPPEHTTILPFTRGLAGPMDFTFGTFNFANPVHPQTCPRTTVAKQLALYVVIYSPFQMASDLPENYEGKPAFEFIELVPTNWGETIILDGKIGDYVMTARKDRDSGDWYVGAITDENSRKLDLKFDFLGKGKKYKAKIFKDAPGSDWKTNPYPVLIEELEVNSESNLELSLAPGGGAALQIKEVL
jgi:alpha-glucosidase